MHLLLTYVCTIIAQLDDIAEEEPAEEDADLVDDDMTDFIVEEDEVDEYGDLVR